MTTKTSLALLGFLPDTELVLKTLIATHVGDVEWVTATDPRLQGVVINADFVSSPQIQNYIQRSKANIVCCYKDEDGLVQAQSNQIHGLHLKQYNENDLQHFLTQLCGRPIAVEPDSVSHVASTTGNSVKEETVSSVTRASSSANAGYSGHSRREHSAATRPIPQARPSVTTASTRTTSDVSSVNTAELSRDYEALLRKIQRAGGNYLVRYGDNSVWVNTQSSEVFLDFERDKIQGIETARWQSISVFKPPRNARRLQLELWLFETLWQSSIALGDKVDETGLYKLTRWPRPLCSIGRSEALRLAAFIQATPANIATLSSKTGYDETMVRRFLHAGLLSGQVHQTGTGDAGYQASSQPKKVDREKLGLLQRIRAKLGL